METRSKSNLESPAATQAADESQHPCSPAETASIQSIGSGIHFMPTTFRLQPFNPQAPGEWFRTAEVTFRLRGVNCDRTKADLVQEVMGQTANAKLARWFAANGGIFTYSSLKAKLLTEFTLLPSQRAQRLSYLSAQPLGDSTLTGALLEMEELFYMPETADGTRTSIDLMREMFLLRVPATIKNNIPDLNKKTLGEIAELGDTMQQRSRLEENSHGRHITSAIHADLPPTSPIPDDTGDPEAVNAVSLDYRRPRRRPPPATGGQQRPPHVAGGQQRPPTITTGLCYYHQRYGRRAYRCTRPCPWQDQVAQAPKNYVCVNKTMYIKKK